VEGRTRAERVASFSGGRVREFVSAVVECAISSPRESRDLVAAIEESLYEAIEAGRPSAHGRTRARGRAWSATSVSDPMAFFRSGGDDSAVLGYEDLLLVAFFIGYKVIPQPVRCDLN
jgi:hypothetical protein